MSSVQPPRTWSRIPLQQPTTRASTSERTHRRTTAAAHILTRNRHHLGPGPHTNDIQSNERACTVFPHRVAIMPAYTMCAIPGQPTTVRKQPQPPIHTIAVAHSPTRALTCDDDRAPVDARV